MKLVQYLHAHLELVALFVFGPILLVRVLFNMQLQKDLSIGSKAKKTDNRLSNTLLGIGFALAFFLRLAEYGYLPIRFIAAPKTDSAWSAGSLSSWIFIIVGCFVRDWDE